MAVWLCRAGRTGEYETRFLEDSKIYLTVQELTDSVVSIGTRAAIKDILRDASPSLTEGAIRNFAGQVYGFAYKMRAGDLVVLPSKITTDIHIGKILGDYEFDANEGEDYRHSRSVDWFANIPRSYFDSELISAMGARMTICQLSQGERIKKVVSSYSEASAPPQDQPFEFDVEGSSYDAIKEHIIKTFKGHGLSHLVAAILRAKGFEVYVSPPGPDHGVDILAASGSLGFGSPKICVQVKSTNDPISRTVLDQLVGTMQYVGAEYGLLVSWGGFRSSIMSDTNAQFFKVRYWTSADIINELFACYENLDDEIRQKIPLKMVWILDSDKM